MVSSGSLVSTSASGKTYTNKVEIKNGELHQTLPDGETRVWIKS
ncbi:MAG TPA: hypothetical protein PKM56_20660 [Candidatus Rifleibacterium sp.]|nr:hypothetical protein [Candidatus Rifleibacterium sp.]